MDNNRVIRSYLVKECELIRNKPLEEIKRLVIFFWGYKNPIYVASLSLSCFTVRWD